MPIPKKRDKLQRERPVWLSREQWARRAVILRRLRPLPYRREQGDPYRPAHAAPLPPKKGRR